MGQFSSRLTDRSWPKADLNFKFSGVIDRPLSGKADILKLLNSAGQSHSTGNFVCELLIIIY